MATTKAAKKARRSARIKSGLLRAVRTFLQALVPSVAVVLVPGVTVGGLTKALIVGAISGGAAVCALIMRWLDYTKVPTIPPG